MFYYYGYEPFLHGDLYTGVLKFEYDKEIRNRPSKRKRFKLTEVGTLFKAAMFRSYNKSTLKFKHNALLKFSYNWRA